MNKVRLIIIVFVCLALYLVYKVYSPIFQDPCGNEIVKTLDSPNREYKAYIFKRNCGSTTETSFQLSVLKVDEKLGNETGNVFITYDDFRVIWENSNNLLVTFPKGAKVFKQNKKISNIDISYHTQ